MRAPPEHDTMIIGMRRSSASSMPRTIFSPTTTPIEPPMKLYSIDAIDGIDAVDLADADDHRVLLPGGFLRRGEPRLVRLGVGELQRIVRRQVRRNLLPPLIVEQRLQPLGGAEAEVMRALAADVEVLDEILGVDDGVAFRTLHPQTFGNPAGLSGRRNRLARLLEPRHIGQITVVQLTVSSCQLAVRLPTATQLATQLATANYFRAT